MRNTDHAEKVHAYAGPEGFAFFSYSHADQAELMPCFREVAAHYRFWYDEGIKSGQEWIDEIGEKIYNCDLFVVFLSENALNSRYIRDEILFAYKYAKHTLAVFLEPVTLGRSLEFILGRFQHVIWYEEHDQAKNCSKLTEGFPDSIRITSSNNPVPSPDSEASETAGEETVDPVMARITDQYETIRKLGEGGFGVVELIRARKTGAEYVLKHSHSPETDRERKILGKAVARNELQKLLLLADKPYVPVLIDYYESEDDYYIVISRIAGLSLKTILSRYASLVSPDMALSLVYHIALILKDIHEAGLVYGDVKPSNFIFDHFGRLSLIDFGSTSALDDRNYLKIYTPKYAAPEQKEKQRKPDYRFDVYGLGVMMQEMLEIARSAWRPVPSGVESDYLWAQYPGSRQPFSGGYYPDASRSGEMIDRICSKMAALAPAARYANMGEVVAALELICPQNSALLLKQLADSIDNWDTEDTSAPDGSKMAPACESDPDSTPTEPMTGFSGEGYYTTAVSFRPDFYYGSSDETVF